MAAAMDVDTPSGTNSGAGKKRFEVKKVSSVRPTRPQLLRKSARLLGESVTTLFISTASLGGSKPGRCAPWTTESGSSKSMGIRKDSPVKLTHLLLV
ncbi:ring-box 1, isoform CRA_a [Rattus norvegicus]|uniref:Ring-box 1, isoform CRA_a n=1 Tax=Rattus norvegicus TaxID=10116 RepID=A6HT00_RAT|nr:ring-box 1, isoform CRA_a [Rattus norvegicus]